LPDTQNLPRSRATLSYLATDKYNGDHPFQNDKLANFRKRE
jgi:hypothetical protein